MRIIWKMPKDDIAIALLGLFYGYDHYGDLA
jgi:hypothetical protein